MLLFLLRSLLCQDPRVLWKVLLSPDCPSFLHQRLKTVGKPHLTNCFLSPHPNLKKKKKSCLSLKEKLGESCVPYAHTGQQLPSICSGVAQRAPFLKKLIEAGVCCAWCLCVCVCVCCVCVCAVCVYVFCV